MPNVGGVDLAGAILKQTICETTRGRTHIKAKPIPWLNLESFQCSLQLQAAPSNVSFGLLNLQSHIRVELCTRLISTLATDMDAARHDCALRPLPAFKHPSLHKQDIQTLFHASRLSQIATGFTDKINGILFALSALLILPL
jgi:hypothetical protein